MVPKGVNTSIFHPMDQGVSKKQQNSQEPCSSTQVVLNPRGESTLLSKPSVLLIRRTSRSQLQVMGRNGLQSCRKP